MSKWKPWSAFFVGLTLAAGIGFLVWPRDCDQAIDGSVSVEAWGENVLARISGGRQDCDPWDRVEPGGLIEEIKISYSINAFAGPAITDMYIRPDGRGFVYSWNLNDTPPNWLAPEEGLLKIAAGNYPTSFTFEDKELYGKIRKLVAPLRNATSPIPSEWRTLAKGASAKTIIKCERDGYHSSYTIDWSQQPFADWSYFDNSFGHGRCPALRFAVARLSEARRLMGAKVPQDLVERLIAEKKLRADR